MIIIGVDPGLSGAIAFLDPPAGLTVFDMPTRKKNDGKREVDAVELAELVAIFAPFHSMAIVEDVHSMPEQGVASTFAFGKAAGVALGVLAANLCHIHMVRPVIWKGLMGLSSDKSQSIAKAVFSFPKYAASFGRKKDDGRAEAALLALFGYKQFSLKPLKET